jgi:pyruvate/2-oxoglutarate/acetoin dehydrogenase E1 component/TPP-dependent pyruvate/acetoin dehydrogenase alpha subunit
MNIDSEQLLSDYKLACISREASLRGRSEVIGSGRAKFGIFGDGKEIAQLAMARFFKPGDFRSGYYRDQTFMMSIGALTVRQHFAALYAHTDPQHEPSSSGRQMNGHFSTMSVNPDGQWRALTEQYNSSADVSPTASQMPRLLGLAQASKIYRHQAELAQHTLFSRGGDEVAFGTIGDASTSEGMFWETLNAAAVMQVPMLVSVWDDGYGISVSKRYQTVKSSISEALSGFAGEVGEGIKIYRVKGWDYFELLKTYEEAVQVCREHHVPVLVHVEEMTQPQGHSTSGSHTRYKSQERLAWEDEYDCIRQLGLALVERGHCDQATLDTIRRDAKNFVEGEQTAAWLAFRESIDQMVDRALTLISALVDKSACRDQLAPQIAQLRKNKAPLKRDAISLARKAIHLTRNEHIEERQTLISWYRETSAEIQAEYSDQLYSEGAQSALKVTAVPPTYDDNNTKADGRIILRDNFQRLFERHPEALTFGEDTGQLGGVNQVMEGMQTRFGELRVSDTGIRECTIMGQGIGLAMRGLRPIAEIQYLDYIYYALQIMRDDLATVRYRTRGKQRAPVIVRTRGHRLEGIWHSGSPMGAIINSVRGIYVCVPRDMTRAAGMYNTLMESDDPALVVECLNGYRSKEPMPTNLGAYTIPLGVIDILRPGKDLTMVSYGSTLKLCQVACERLAAMEIDVELIDVQTLLPFDLDHQISASIKRTNRVIFIDEDVPGGTSAYMLDQVINKQDAFFELDSEPRTLSAQPHLPAYGSDGDYFSKPSIEDIVEAAYQLMHESHPARYPRLI